MRILLTAPPYYVYWLKKFNNIYIEELKRNSGPPLSLYLLASILREKHSAEILDPLSHQIKFDEDGIQFPSIEKRLNEVDAIGISATSVEWFLARVMIERIKDYDPGIPIIVGGVHASFVDEHILKTSKVDYVVRGEGEKTLPELLEAIEENKSFKDIRGITYRDKEDEKIIRNEERPPLTVSEMEETPLPAFDLLPSNTHGVISVQSSRGCKFGCIFCCIPFRNLWRGLRPEIVQKRVEHALNYTKRLFGDKKGIHIIDDTFTTDKKRAVQILHNLSETDFGDAILGFDARANDLDADIMKLCKKIPINRIQMGVECGYEEGLKRIRKGIRVSDVERCALLAKENGISNRLVYNFIIGFPWETKEDCMKTINFAYGVVSKFGGGLMINWLQFLPGSYLWENRKSYGIDKGPDIFDTFFWESKELRSKISPKLKKDDLVEMENSIKAYNVLLSVIRGKDFIHFPSEG